MNNKNYTLVLHKVHKAEKLRPIFCQYLANVWYKMVSYVTSMVIYDIHGNKCEIHTICDNHGNIQLYHVCEERDVALW